MVRLLFQPVLGIMWVEIRGQQSFTFKGLVDVETWGLKLFYCL